MTSSPLNIILWNSRSIRNKYIEFFDYLIKTNVDICLLSETWLKSNIKVSHPIFNCIRFDRESKNGGGVAIVIRNSIQYEILPNITTHFIENVGIEILSRSNVKTKIISVYFPGGRCNGDSRTKYKNDLKKILSCNTPFIICGDLNSRHKDWGCLRANSWGNILSDLTTTLPFVIKSPLTPTYIPAATNANASILDLILTNVPNKITQPITLNALGSDHLPVKFTFSSDHISSTKINLDLKNTNWKKYRRNLKNIYQNQSFNLNNINNSAEIDHIIETFSNNIINSFRNVTPKINSNTFSHVKLPNYIIGLIKIRNQYRRDWIKYRQILDLNSLNFYITLVKNEIFKYKNK